VLRGIGPDGRALRDGVAAVARRPSPLVASPHVRESPAFRYVLHRASADRLVRRSRADAAHTAAGRSGAEVFFMDRRRLPITMHSIYGARALQVLGLAMALVTAALRRTVVSRSGAGRAGSRRVGARSTASSRWITKAGSRRSPGRRAHVRYPRAAVIGRRMASDHSTPATRAAPSSMAPLLATGEGPILGRATRADRIAGRW